MRAGRIDGLCKGLGYDSLISKTHSDDGRTWRRVPSGVTTYLNGIISDNRGAFVAVGAKGVILRSADFGNTWTTIPSSVTESLSAVAFDEGRRCSRHHFLTVSTSSFVATGV